ncbi:GIY-YIG nuclease family protein [Lysobacter arenosi]|uniref:GIY-YIG nuclease family protein n=1 Tax=Lysobacter arenosi TaxID=2795387 RepID=A0ABX7R9Q4_9GAMM|nr:GIY-YIG nuclease family protein [Lysobacter arenosi]QSX74455.1 GIY-YIG nuclease family protein [Lysobacter arenosi]
MLQCGGDRYYLGATHDLAARLAKHRKGQGSQFTRTHGVIALVGAIDVGTRSEAMREERRLKRWSTARKVAYFQQYAHGEPGPALVAPWEERRTPDHENEAHDIIVLIGLLNGGDYARARQWFLNEPLEELGGRTADYYVRHGGVESVRRYVLNLSAGSTG